MAKNKDNKKRRLRWMIAGGAVAAALLLGWCGRGWFGGGGSGDEADDAEQQGEIRPAMAAPPVDAGKAPRCRVRIDEAGATVGGQVATAEEVIAACTPSGEAELVTTGLARYGTVEAIEKALEGAGVRIYRVGTKRPPDGPEQD